MAIVGALRWSGRFSVRVAIFVSRSFTYRIQSGLSCSRSSATSGLEPEVAEHVGADDLQRVFGTDGLDHVGQGLLGVAEGALVVRVVGRPHHPVDADAV